MISEGFYDCIAEQYDTYFKDADSKKEDEMVRGHLAPFSYCKPPKKVLDIGCGTGLLLELLYFEDYIGLDPSAGMLEVFKNKFPLEQCIKTKFEEYRPVFQRDVLISLYGSISYINPSFLNDTMKYFQGDYYLMFYSGFYKPVTYEKAGLKAEHYDISEYQILNEKGNIYHKGNFTIYTTLSL